ncbi:T9SS type A sorting domain-containing protein [Bacteroidia bacterium]|nr:T9SS type A sorting domain-containing protein [Bacteroidia bacterium]
MKSIFTLSILSLALALQSQTITNFKTSDGLPNNNVLCLTADASNNMWFGTQSGVAKYNGSLWTIYDKTSNPEIPNNTITAIAALRNGNIWIGTDYGVSVYDGSKWTTYTTADGLGSNRINYITELMNGDIWISDFNGATKYSGATFTKYGSVDGLPFGGVQQIQEAKNGDIIMATGLGGLVKYDGSNFEAYKTTEGLLSNSSTSLALDNGSNIWVGTGAGVSVFDSNYTSIENFTRLYKLPEPDTLNPVEDVKIDSKGQIWVGIYVDYLVSVGGVSMYDGNTWVEFDESNGLAGPTIRNMCIDLNDNVWVATSKGVSRINSGTSSVSKIFTQGFHLFPNPTRNLLTIAYEQHSGANNTSIKIYNTAGQLQLTQPLSVGFSTTLSMKSFTPGFYIVKVGNRTKKIEIY